MYNLCIEYHVCLGLYHLSYVLRDAGIFTALRMINLIRKFDGNAKENESRLEPE